MIHSFNRRRGAQACIGGAMIALAAAFVGLGLIFPVRPVGLFAILFGLFVGWLAASLILDIFAPDPILKIGPEGIYFLPFSPKTVPWRDIAAVTANQGYYFGTSGIESADGKWTVSYAIRDPSAYPKRGGVSGVARATMTGGSITLNTLTLVKASGADILAAFREHYPGAITTRPIPQ